MRQAPDNIIGGSLALTEALDHLSQLAPIARPVLVLGERGTGKELAGQRLHFLSPRWDAPFVKINCARHGPSPCWRANSSAMRPGPSPVRRDST